MSREGLGCIRASSRLPVLETQAWRAGVQEANQMLLLRAGPPDGKASLSSCHVGLWGGTAEGQGPWSAAGAPPSHLGFRTVSAGGPWTQSLTPTPVCPERALPCRWWPGHLLARVLQEWPVAQAGLLGETAVRARAVCTHAGICVPRPVSVCSHAHTCVAIAGARAHTSVPGAHACTCVCCPCLWRALMPQEGLKGRKGPQARLRPPRTLCQQSLEDLWAGTLPYRTKPRDTQHWGQGGDITLT